MMIKKWNQFIVEKQLQIFKGTSDEYPELEYNNYYPISEEDIRDYLMEMEDAHYNININYGFVDNTDTRGNTRDGKTDTIFFTEYIKSVDNIPLIEVCISTSDKTTDDDVTSCLKSFVRRVKHLFDKIIIRDDNGELDIDYITMKGEILTDSLELEGDLVIQCVWGEEIHFSHKMMFDNLNVVIDKDVHLNEKGECTFDISRETLSNHLVSNYHDILSDDDIDFDRWYDDSHYYTPEHDSFFQYDLDSDNIKLLLNYCFRDYESIKSEYSDKYDFLNDFDSTEDFVSRYHESISDSQLGKFLVHINDELYEQLLQDYATMCVDSKSDSDIDAIYEAFDKEVEDGIGRINKQFKRTLVRKDKDGNDISYEKTYYNINFDYSWLFEYADYDRDSYVDDIVLHYVDQNLYKTELRPNFSDYADIDHKQFNDHVKSEIQYRMKKLKI